MKEILKSFIGGYRFERPFTQGEYVYATDECILIRVRKDLAGGKYPVRKKPQISGMFIEMTHEQTVTVRQLKKLISGATVIEEAQTLTVETKCNECDGGGRVIWHYEGWRREDYCPVCDGRGAFYDEKTVKTGRMIPDPHCTLELHTKKFSAKYITKILDTMEYLDIPAVTMKYDSDPRHCSMFTPCDGIDILLMGVLTEDDLWNDLVKSTVQNDSGRTE
jgi:hypothetical protein